MELLGLGFGLVVVITIGVFLGFAAVLILFKDF